MKAKIEIEELEAEFEGDLPFGKNKKDERHGLAWKINLGKVKRPW